MDSLDPARPAEGSAEPGSTAGRQSPAEDIKVSDLVIKLLYPKHREQALFELSKRRETSPDLALVLWHSAGVMTLLIQEIIGVYPYLSPPELTMAQSNRVCNALALLQTIASNQETRVHLLNAHIPLFLYPFLNTTSSSREFDYLRLTSLGVIGALVKADDEEVIKFVLNTEIVPLCLKIMDKGIELSRTVATFIVQKVIQIDIGLKYVCATPERFMAVSNTLKTMVIDSPTPRLLKHIIRCYLRLTDHLQAREALQQHLPTQLRDITFKDYLNEDVNMRKWLYQLLLNISDPYVTEIHKASHKQIGAPAGA
ncbi:cell differentiation protein rcd1 [Perkinsela sp. CCAP 1560/4]|nr:cell differentiation protein rcd1 [Perkinsela sp. CCAP 1560/4]|eukprot:KNH05567.1 cell differentiation protein rcd1 [Perkinsela sp. CCAP 1560/4]